MDNKFPYGDPEAIEKKRALEFYHMSWEEKYARLMTMIRISYEIRESRKNNASPAKK